MATNRRAFVRQLGGALALGSIASAITPADIVAAATRTAPNPLAAAADEDFWWYVQQAYTVSPNIVNLNNGGVCPQPKVVQEQFEKYNRLSNEAPSYYMWRVLDQGREPLRARLAQWAGAATDEVAIVRNTTEALAVVVFGLNLKAGDEVVLTRQDYPNMINAWRQREQRDGIKLVWLDFKLPIESDDAFVQAFENTFTDKTRVVHITHMINWTGQILPAAKIAAAARKRGIEVLVDGAHTLGHLDFKIADLGCDYFGSSLHKWLSAPFGTGLLYVRKEKIAKLWPLFPNDKPDSADIRKYEAQGTRSFATEMAIGTALDFQLGIGAARKQARLHYLQRRWTDVARTIKGVTVNTSPNPAYACALANFSIAGLKPQEVDAALFNKYKIHAVAIEWANISGVRVTPHVYTKVEDVDKLARAIEEIAAGKKS
jgi:selenocysteine lyase/cysteine desulfurase